LTVAKAQLDTAKSSSSSDTMQLDVQQTEIQLQEMKDTLDKFSIYAVSDGVVMSKSYVLGDMVAPGYNLADIAADGQKYFVFYLPIDYVNSIDYDQTFQIKADEQKYDGIVKYIDVESEFTPKDMQTAANKNKESVKVKLLLPKDCPLKPGQEAELYLNLQKK
jgi:HlyD family secretion protein